MAVSLKQYDGANQFFINPYNFVPVDFEKEPERKEASAQEGTHTGVLECEVITKTPLAIPETGAVVLNAINKKHKEYDFMRTHDGRLMIPGSALRGPVRSMYEALTNSCLVTADGEAGITVRKKEAFQAGLIRLDENGVWHLYQAKRYIFAVTESAKYRPFTLEPGILKVTESDLKRYSYGHTVYIRPVYEKDGRSEKVYRKGRFEVGTYISEMSEEPGAGMREGYVCIGEPFSRKHFESVFVGNREIPLDGKEDILKNAVRMLDEIVKMYNDETVNVNAKNNRHFYRGRNYKNAPAGVFLPIWYQIEKTENGREIDRIYLSVADIGRSAYNKTMGDMIQSHHGCTDRASLCPACRLFGMTGTQSRGTRIRFTDAVTNEPVKKSGRVPLKELAGPKTSYMPFYLSNRKTDKDSWSYDSNTVSLRGRKFYWHNTEKEAYMETTEGNQKGDRNQSMELAGVDGEERFRFSVFYEALTDQELSELIWTLTLGENREDSKACHKIGHGKPIGLGSVKIIIRSQMERSLDESGYHVIRKTQQEVGAGETGSFDGVALKTVREIVKLDAAKYPVSYPGVVNANGKRYGNDGKNDHASHKWFSENFQLGKAPVQVLPDVLCASKPENALIWVTDDKSEDIREGRNGGSIQTGGRPRPQGVVYPQTDKGKRITVTLKGVKPDKEKQNVYVSFYMENRGMVFQLPESVKDGDRVVIRITNTEKGHGQYVEKA